METVALPAGFTAHNDRETLEVAVCGDALIHVTSRPLGAPEAAENQPWMLAKTDTCPGAPFQFSQSNGVSTLTTSRLAVTLSDRDGNLTFKNADGQTLLRERSNLPRTWLPSQAAGLYHIEDRFSPDSTEALYGLGQHQSGMFNYRGSTVELGQNNTDIAIPLLVSSKGYAILWNTASFSYVDNRFPLDLEPDLPGGVGTFRLQECRRALSDTSAGGMYLDSFGAFSQVEDYSAAAVRASRWPARSCACTSMAAPSAVSSSASRAGSAPAARRCAQHASVESA